MNAPRRTPWLLTGAVVVAVGLALATEAEAHVTVAPAYLEDGVPAVVRFSMPNERAPHATVGLEVSVPAGITILSAAAATPWRTQVTGKTVTWDDARLSGTRTARFTVRLRPDLRAGTYAFSAVQRYDDGDVVRWQVLFSALPATGRAAPKQRTGRAVVAGALGLIAIAGGLAAFRAIDRRRR